MLTWNLKPIFKARGIERPYTFLVKAGISRHSATSILSSELFSMNLRHIEILCEVLNCTPSNLLQWTPNPHRPMPPDHQLHKLRSQATSFDLPNTLKSIPIEKLNEIAAIISPQNPPPQP